MDDQLPPDFPAPIFPGQAIPGTLGKDITPSEEKQRQERLRGAQAEQALKSAVAAPDARTATTTSGLTAAILQSAMPEETQKSQVEEIAASIEEAHRTEPLMPEELQKLRELIYTSAEKIKARFTIPDLPITDKDRDIFMECVLAHRPYKETFTMMNGKLVVVFREKLKRETDLIFDQIERDFQAGTIRSDAAFGTKLQNYNMVVQMVSVNGAPMTSVIPAKVSSDWKLVDAMQGHICETFSEHTMFILIGALTQFERKVRTMSEEIIKANFSAPVAVS